MTSKYTAVNRLLFKLIDRREDLRFRLQCLSDNLYLEFPPERFGSKADRLFQLKSVKVDEEITTLSLYISGLYDLIEAIEGGKENE